MTVPSPRVGIEILREAARERRNETSLRRTAGEIGLSATGLAGFLAGNAPYPHTINKLTRWYVGRTRELGAVLTADEAGAMLDLLLSHLSGRWKAKAVRRIVETVGEIGRGAGVPPPEWLGKVQKERHGEG